MDDGTTVTIADAAPHYPLTFDENGQREWQFLDWNKVTPIAPPPAGQIADPGGVTPAAATAPGHRLPAWASISATTVSVG
jgi:hypothetical protein